MTERFERTPSLRDVQLHGRSLAAWHRFLTTDTETFEPTGHLETGGSRYGKDGDAVSWWAIACAAIYEDANGEAVDAEALMDEYMGYAVNDSDTVLTMVRDHYYAVPAVLKARLEYYDGDCNLAQQAALGGLCSRYEVQFEAAHYTPQFDLPSGYVAGWIGGFAIQKEHPTIYVGCSEAGEISS